MPSCKGKLVLYRRQLLFEYNLCQIQIQIVHMYKSESMREDCSQLTEDKLGFFAELPQKPLSGGGGRMELNTAKIH